MTVDRATDVVTLVEPRLELVSLPGQERTIIALEVPPASAAALLDLDEDGRRRFLEWLDADVELAVNLAGARVAATSDGA